jgi:hypothetical protein
MTYASHGVQLVYLASIKVDFASKGFKVDTIDASQIQNIVVPNV